MSALDSYGATICPLAQTPEVAARSRTQETVACLSACLSPEAGSRGDHLHARVA